MSVMMKLNGSPFGALAPVSNFTDSFSMSCTRRSSSVFASARKYVSKPRSRAPAAVLYPGALQ